MTDHLPEEQVLMLARTMIDTARKLLEKDRQLTPVIHIIDRDGGLNVVGVPDMGTPDRKEDAARMIKEELDRLEAQATILMVEAWMVSGQDANYALEEGLRAGQMLRRQEVVHVTVELPGKAYVASIPIVRLGNRPTFGRTYDFQEFPIRDMGGMFQGLLRENRVVTSRGGEP